jgi:hypothetical protein
MQGHLKFAYEVLHQIVANWDALNWTVWSQTKACITKSREICALLR